MSDETVREDWNATVREGQNAAATLREGQAAAGAGGIGAGATFQGYRVVRQLPSKGSEADIFVVEKDAAQYILKQYRYGINPKRDILLAIKALSESHPHEFVRLFDADFDAASGRWYEIQEYVPNGSLQSLMADRSLLTGAQQATFFTDVVRELADDLNALHQNNLLHLDLKPSNILLRSIHPLNLVLIDFGIATSLASDMSKKFTQVRGTPMYQSPESYSGGMGRPADWWGLGMILLEIAAGAHPFKGLSNNIIAYAISTEPVPVPEDLDAGRKELLQGLLTRDPEKRWSYEQVVRWLSGERSIPQHFETAPAMQAQPAGNASLKPLKFMDRQYQSLAELAAAFLKDEPSWEKGKGFLIRGYVRQWLEKNEEFDAIMDIDAVLSGAEDPDEKVFCFVQRFGGDMPFAFGGHLITLENLLLFAGKVLKRQPVTAMEQKIVDSIANGILLSCLDFYKQQGRVSGTVRDLEPVLKTLEGKTWEQIVKILDIFIHPENSGMTIQEIAKRIEEQERKEQQERLEREKREQERKEQQERLEREKKERERREQQERLALKASFLNVSVGSTVKFGHYEQDNNTSNGKEE
ncbi:MAG: serine/threonine protein kinase, partial [Deltaproteobacteria bacterium]|nr:serine/threonine protein kinase [Deltaproteobacteria bacterium]